MTAISETKRIDIDVECAVTDAPLNLLATAQFGEISLSWTNVDSDAVVQIFRDDILIDTAPAGSTTYLDTPVTVGIEFCYRIRYVGAAFFSNESCATALSATIMDFNTTNTSAGSSNSDQIRLPLTGTTNIVVDWGDGSALETITDPLNAIHTYSLSGAYTVKWGGTITDWAFSNSGDRLKILDISDWGDMTFGTAGEQFYGCANLDITATNTPDLTGATVLDRTFRGCSSLVYNSTIDNWDISNVNSMSATFEDCSSFNQGLNSWDTSSVTTFGQLFDGCTAFNGDISSWSTSLVTNFSGTFRLCSAFNQDISGWNVSAGTTFADMFLAAVAFNQNISTWSPSSATTFNGMFESAVAFNQPIGAWGSDVSGVTDFRDMFRSAAIFNQPLDAWVINTSSSVNMQLMFVFATSFNQPLNSWNVSMVTNFFGTFSGCSSFNGNITGWNTTSATTMQGMFSNCTNFDQDISGWDVATVANMNGMFALATSFDRDLGGWDISSLTDAGIMFNGVTLSTSNYDSLLIGWEANSHNNNVVFNGGNSQYTLGGAAETARTDLIGDGWTITDGGGV